MAVSKKKPAKPAKKAAKPEPKKVEKKPAKVEQKAAKKPAKQATPRKAAVKITPKKAESKPKDIKVKKAGKSGVKVFTPSNEKEGKRVYHISKRPDGKWAVKFAGGEKAIKLFNTQAEAKEYTKKMAENQDGVVLVHNSKGKNKGRIQ